MIDPNVVTTARVGELPSAPFELTDKIPHEIEETLFQGTVLQLADLIGDYLGTSSSLAFNPTTVVDGGTLPETDSNEWMLVGKGTFHNVGGGSDIITTEELNAVTSNGTYWSLAVEIPVNVELAGITQNIRSGYTTTTPSEDKLYNTFALYTKTIDLPAIPVLFPKIQITAAAGQTVFPLGTTSLANGVLWNGVGLNDDDWSQTGSNITTIFPLSAGDIFKPF